jgi:predicted permease
MSRARAWLARVAGLFGRERRDRELSAELESHLALHIDDNLRVGMTPETARRQALIKLGGLEQAKQLYREQRGIPWLENLWRDARYGARTLRNSPGFTLAAVLTLALGIGANTAIFSVVDAVLLRSLPYRDAGRLVLLRETTARVGEVSVSYQDFLDWRKQNHVFSGMAAVHDVSFDLSGVGRPQRISGYGVSPNFLSLLGVSPILGRDFEPREEKPGAAPVVLLSYRFWQSHFGGSSDVLGKTLQLDGRSYTIVGVLPATFRFLQKADVFAPIGLWARAPDLNHRGSRNDMDVVGRLAPGVSLAQARVEMRGIAARLARVYPVMSGGIGVRLKTMRDAFVGQSRPALLIVFGAVLLVLLIASVNVAGLFLVRGAARAREIAVRLAFGAGRGRIVRQLLTESLLLAALGGGLGAALGAWGIDAIAHLLPSGLLTNAPIRFDRGVFLFVGLLVILVALAFGLIPALQATRTDVQETLKEGGRSESPGAGQQRLRSALAVAETALALMLLIGSGLILNSFYRLMKVSPGFQPARVVQMEMGLRSSQYSTPAAQLNFWGQVLERVRALPGVEAAAVGTVVPFTDDHWRSDVTIEGMPLPAQGAYPHPDYHIVSPGFLATLRIPLLRGRGFAATDNEDSRPVALVNARFARRFWPGGKALGKRFLFGHPGPESKNRWITIIGVAGDTRLYGLDHPPRLEVYVPLAQHAVREMHLVVRSAANPAGLIPAIRSAVAAVDGNLPISGIATMQREVDDSVTMRRITLILLASFSALAVVLAAIGIYGVVSYLVALRTHEIGIRMALGAEPASVLRLVVGQGARLAGMGVALGLAGALALAGMLRSLLYGISASDPATIAGAAALIVAVALLATYLPARRATKIDPTVALRQE